MKYKSLAAKIYLINLALLATHEIDSAYWHEWELFHLPGGIDLFLIINLIILFVFFTGFEKVVTWQKGAWTYSLILAISGLFAFTIHSFFIIKGNPEFNTVISWSILLSSFIISIVQLIVLVVIYRTATNIQ